MNPGGVTKGFGADGDHATVGRRFLVNDFSFSVVYPTSLRALVLVLALLESIESIVAPHNTE